MTTRKYKLEIDVFTKIKDDLTKIICEYFEIEYEKYEEVIILHPRRQPHMFVDHTVRYILRLGGLVYTDIGKLTNRNHASIISSICMIDDILETNFKYKLIKSAIESDKRVKYLFKKIKCKTRHNNPYLNEKRRFNKRIS